MSRSQTSPSPLLPQSRVASPPSVNTSSPSGSSKRRHLIREIATTERAYANDLALIRDAYMTRYTRPTSAISLSEYNNAAAGTSNSNVSASPGMSETSRRSSVYTYQTAETKRSSGYESSTPWLAPNGASTTLLTKSPLMDPTAGSYFPPVPVPAAPVSASLQTPQRHARNISGTSIASTNMPPPVGKPLSPADVKVVFMNLDQLAAAAEELALAFEQSMGDEPEKVEKGKEGENGSDKLGEVFTNLVSGYTLKAQYYGSDLQMPRFRGLYLSYCSRQSAAALRLVELQADPSYRAYLDDCWRQVKPFTRAWNLDSMLIKPVQRVTKYPLLFEDLLSCTTPVHPDYFSIRSAAELSRAVAGEIDEAKRRKDVVAGIVSRKPQTSTSTTSKDSKSGGLGKGLKLFRKEKSITSLPASISTTDLPPASISRASLDYYRELVRDFEQYQICVKRLGQEMLFWTAAAKEICTIQDGLINVWMRVVQLDGNDVDQRMVAFRKTLAGIVNTAWTPLVSLVQKWRTVTALTVEQRGPRLAHAPSGQIARFSDEPVESDTQAKLKVPRLYSIFLSGGRQAASRSDNTAVREGFRRTSYPARRGTPGVPGGVHADIRPGDRRFCESPSSISRGGPGPDGEIYHGAITQKGFEKAERKHWCWRCP